MLTLVERPVPIPGPEEILVAVAAAGVNRRDVMQRTGFDPAPPNAPDIPGLEISGVVVCVGAAVSRWKEGDRVVALVIGGGYAEFCAVHETNVLPLPESLTLLEGAAIPETTFTVWHNVFQRGRLKPDEWLLVHGGSSGIGTTAIQLAKACGAFVATTVGSNEKCVTAHKIGADVTINYRTEDFVVEVHRVTGGQGADVILDIIGGNYLDRNMAAAAEDGRIVQISTLAGSVRPIDLWKLLTKRLTLTGSTLRTRSVQFKAALAREIEKEVWPLILQGHYKPIIDTIYHLEHAAESHRQIDSSAHIGKIILKI